MAARLALALETALFVAVVVTAMYFGLDYARTGHLFSLWVPVLLGMLTFWPLARRRLIHGWWKSGSTEAKPLPRGDVGAVYFIQFAIFALAAATVIILGLELKRSYSPAALWAFMLLGALSLWPMFRHRIVHGRWPA